MAARRQTTPVFRKRGRTRSPVFCAEHRWRQPSCRHAGRNQRLPDFTRWKTRVCERHEMERSHSSIHWTAERRASSPVCRLEKLLNGHLIRITSTSSSAPNRGHRSKFSALNVLTGQRKFFKEITVPDGARILRNESCTLQSRRPRLRLRLCPLAFRPVSRSGREIAKARFSRQIHRSLFPCHYAVTANCIAATSALK